MSSLPFPRTQFLLTTSTLPESASLPPLHSASIVARGWFRPQVNTWVLNQPELTRAQKDWFRDGFLTQTGLLSSGCFLESPEASFLPLSSLPLLVSFILFFSPFSPSPVSFLSGMLSLTVGCLWDGSHSATSWKGPPRTGPAQTSWSDSVPVPMAECGCRLNYPQKPVLITVRAKPSSPLS